MKGILLFLVSALLMRGEPPASQRRIVEAKLLQGRWQMTEFYIGGHRPEGAELGVYVFQGDQLWIEDADGAIDKKMPFTIDPQTNPKRIDWGDEEWGVLSGIYLLRGDVLTLRFPLRKAPRPKTFDLKKDRKSILIRLKRISKDKDHGERRASERRSERDESP